MPFPLEQKWIEAAESKLGTRFPASYKAAMTKRNGGSVQVSEVEWELYPIRDDSSSEQTRRTVNDVVYETRESRKWQDFPSKGVAIGADGTGDKLVFISLGDGQPLQPTVYWWDHEYGLMREVAANFSELVTG